MEFMAVGVFLTASKSLATSSSSSLSPTNSLQLRRLLRNSTMSLYSMTFSDWSYSSGSLPS